MTRPWWWWLFAEWRAYVRREQAALPDGTRVRLVCSCQGRDHEGIWVTSWTPRRMRDHTDVDDYLLTRETDAQTTYAARDALEVVGP